MLWGDPASGTFVRMIVVACLATTAAAGMAQSESTGTAATCSTEVTTGDSTMAKNGVYSFTMRDIDGNERDLAQYAGDVLLVVNTASRCGLTPQYEGLEKLYEQYKDRGFEVLAFPANEFGQQEPGTNEEIKQFCSMNYSVTFPLFQKIVVKGDGQHPLYTYLTEQVPKEELRGEIQWNFTKFLIARDGTVVARFEPRVTPEDEKLVAALQTALTAQAP